MTRLTKTLTRDSNYFMQSLFADGMLVGLNDLFGQENPHTPVTAHSSKNGLITIWENLESIDWILGQFLEKNKRSEYLRKLLEQHKEVSDKLRALAKEGLEEKDLDRFVALLREGEMGVLIFYYCGNDERNDDEVLKIALEGREYFDLFSEMDLFVKDVFQKLYGVSEEQTTVILPNEIHNLPSKEELDKRLKSSLIIDGKLVCVGDFSDYFDGKDGVELFEEKIGMSDSIKGQSAFSGVVEGVVKLVAKRSDMEKVEEGDVLVSPMTTPELLPAMKLASAFVTDEGGITCHAAIVAREMKKPCVIGTRGATQIFNDGDRVRVDAKNGIVEKI